MSPGGLRLEGSRSPGYFDAEARLKDMDRDGVDVEVLYSELSSFRHFHLVKDGWRDVARAFNDHLADFAAVDPERLVVSYQIPIIDIDHAIAEVQRLAALGARSVQLPNYPTELGFADYHDARYDPLWSALEETDISISQHLGPKASLWDVFRRDPTPQKAIFTSLPAMALAENMAWWILTGVLERHPGLQDRVRRAGPGLGALLPRHPRPPGGHLRLPGHHRTAQRVLPPQHVTDLHGRSPRGRHAP